MFDILIKRALLPAALSLGLISSAMAADAIDDIPTPPPTPDPVVGELWDGIYFGGALGGAAINIDPGGSEWGIVGGIFAGYNIQQDNFVFSPEIDIDTTNVDIGGVEFDAIARITGRIGYAFDRTLLTGIAGAAYASTGGAAELSGWGWLVGTGIDYAVTENIFAGTEYLYHSFGDIDNSGLDVGAHTVKARVGFKF